MNVSPDAIERLIDLASEVVTVRALQRLTGPTGLRDPPILSALKSREEKLDAMVAEFLGADTVERISQAMLTAAHRERCAAKGGAA